MKLWRISSFSKIFVFLLLLSWPTFQIISLSFFRCLYLEEGLGGHTYERRYLTFIFRIKLRNFDLIVRKKRQRERPLVMTFESPRLGARSIFISSLTWASCVAYPLRWQPRPDDGVSKSLTPTSFLYPFGLGCHRTFI